MLVCVHVLQYINTPQPRQDFTVKLLPIQPLSLVLRSELGSTGWALRVCASVTQSRSSTKEPGTQAGIPSTVL